MKRFLSIFVIIALAFSFFACKKKNEEPTKQETKAPEEEVVEIDEQNSDVTDLKFAEPKQLVPENPVPSEGPVDLTFKLEGNAKVDVAATDTDPATTNNAKVELTLNFKANTLTIKELKDLECLADVSLSVKTQQNNEVEQEVAKLQVTLYLKAGVLYANVPGSLLGSEGDMVVSVDLNKVLEAVEEIVKELASSVVTVEGEGEIDLTQFTEMKEVSLTELLKAVRSLAPGLEEAGFSDEFIGKIVDLLNNLLPKLTYQDKTFKLVLSKDTVGELVDKVVAFAKENLATINGIVGFLANAPEGTELLTADVLDTLKPSVLEQLEPLTIKDAFVNFGLDKTNRVNKIDAKADFEVTDTFEEWDDAGKYTQKEGVSAWLITLNSAWEASKASLKFTASEDRTIDGKKSRAGSLSFEANAEATEKGAQATLKFVINEKEEKAIELEANCSWEKIEKGLQAQLSAKFNNEETSTETSLKASLVNNGGTATTFEFDTTTAVDMTETVIGLIGDALNGEEPSSYPYE